MIEISQVKKKNGLFEEFDRNKVIASIVHAGGFRPEAEQVCNQVEAWLPGVLSNEVIESQALKEKIYSLLNLVNPVAANDYYQFKKSG